MICKSGNRESTARFLEHVSRDRISVLYELAAYERRPETR